MGVLGGVVAPHQYPLAPSASYLIYADVRLHIPMIHNNDRPKRRRTLGLRSGEFRIQR